MLQVQPGEELNISYGSNLWFEDADPIVSDEEDDLLNIMEL